MSYFARNIFSNKISLGKADEDQVELLFQIMDFKKNTKPKNPKKKKFKKML